MSLTKQQMLDRAWAGIKAQGGKSVSGDGMSCRYQMGDQRCAVGHLFKGPVPPELINSNVPVQDAWSFLLDAGIIRTTRYTPNFKFLRELQEAHDGALNPMADINMDDLIHRFRSLATEWSLKFTP